jgi:predicted ATP-grasp superfamily ATP-dependent carboligase
LVPYGCCPEWIVIARHSCLVAGLCNSTRALPSEMVESLVGIPVLLVATTTTWFGTARIPKVLAEAGFDVSLLTPRHSLAEAGRFVAKIGHLADHSNAMQWFEAFAVMVRATAPRLVIPCDDMAFRLLTALMIEPPQRMRADLHLQLAALVRASLGNPAHYRTSVDKTLLPPGAEALGVQVPAYEIVTNPLAAKPFVARHGYPVVLKRGHGFAGQGVAICADDAELARAFDAFAVANAQDIGEATHDRYLLQAHVTGPVQYFHAVAWQGELLAGWALEKLVANPAPTGPPTVTRHFAGTGLRQIATNLARGFGISGLFFAEFILDAVTGTPLLLEINRRISPATHRGALWNVDLCAALFGALGGTASKSRAALDAAEGGTTAHFPQEWLRDPHSRYLRQYPSDVPWDEPELLEAMLKMRH